MCEKIYILLLSTVTSDDSTLWSPYHVLPKLAMEFCADLNKDTPCPKPKFIAECDNPPPL